MVETTRIGDRSRLDWRDRQPRSEGARAVHGLRGRRRRVRARPPRVSGRGRALAGRREPLAVVDLGAGTGKLTRALVALGHRVVAVEPLDEMRAELEAALPAVHALVGKRRGDSAPRRRPPTSSRRRRRSTGSITTTPCPRSRACFGPAGRLALVWNSRDDRDPWMARLSAIIGNESIQESDVVPVLDASGLFGPVETAAFSFQQVLDRDGLLDLVLSRSYLAKLPPAEREPVLDAVGRAVRRDRRRRGRAARLRHRVLPRRAALSADVSRGDATAKQPPSGILATGIHIRGFRSAQKSQSNSRCTASTLLPSGSSRKAA